jgi:parallel beta-helix repeat protein
MNNRVILFLIIVIGLLLVSFVSAATITVCSSGCDYNTIQGAADAVSAGDTVLIREGTYAGFYLDFSGRSDAWITIKNYPGEYVTIDGSIGNAGTGIILISEGASYFVLDGIEITNSDPDEIAGINMPNRNSPNHHIIIQNMEIHDIRDNAILVSPYNALHHDIQIINNTIYNIGFPRSGYAWYGGGDNNLFKGNTVYNAVYGVHATYLKNSIIEDNIIYDCGGRHQRASGDWTTTGDNIDIWGSGNENNIIRNNIVYGASVGEGIRSISSASLIYNNIVYDNSNGIVIEGSDNKVINNIVYKNNINLVTASENTVSDNLVGIDPKFEDEANKDFYYQSDSPAINTGTCFPDEVPVDINGASRPYPSGGNCDIGAYEYGGVVPECTDVDNDTFYDEGGNCGPIDCNDNDPAVNPGIVEDCANGIDDDCDTLIDVNDSDCGTCIPTSNREKGKKCNDGIDNDCDGVTDGDDSDCGSGSGDAEICNDGIDNDNDGKIDCADRKDCRKDPIC